VADALDVTNSTNFPPYADKYELMEDIRHADEETDRLHILNRLGNTDLSTDIGSNGTMTMAQFDAAYIL